MSIQHPAGRGSHFWLIRKSLPAATKLGQGNIFTSVCQEFCPRGEGVCLSACWDTPPPRRHPPDQTSPVPDTPQTWHPWVKSRHVSGKEDLNVAKCNKIQGITSWRKTPIGPDTPRTRHTPQTRTPWEQTPLGAETSPEKTVPHGLRAAGTHPTGMHSCFVMVIYEKNNFGQKVLTEL